MIKRFVELLEKVIPKTIKEEKIECAIDDEVVDCNELDSPPYIGVPAPVYLKDDPWFGPAPEYTEKQQEYRQQEATERLHEELREEKKTCESHDIHAKMYEIATKNWTTVAETQGGSENFQEGPGGWNSGTGYNQFSR